MSRLKSYHFSCGNSTNGPVGFCARVRANSKKEALLLLREALPEAEDAEPYNHEESIEYIQFYTGPENITIQDIDEWEYVEEEEDSKEGD